MSAVRLTRLRVVLPLALVAILVAVATPDHAFAQGRVVRLEGRVLWVAGDVLSLAVNDGPAVSIDLSDVPQSDYAGLPQGEWVAVIARYSSDYRRLNGISITRYAGSESP